MNTSHYPSLDLCKKLTEALFPNNTESYEGAFYYEYSNGKNFISNGHPVWLPENPYQQYLCPSVMELLDVCPADIGMDYRLYTKKCSPQCSTIGDGESHMVMYKKYSGEEMITFDRETLPNALAEMWLWLKENGYLLIK